VFQADQVCASTFAKPACADQPVIDIIDIAKARRACTHIFVEKSKRVGGAAKGTRLTPRKRDRHDGNSCATEIQGIDNSTFISKISIESPEFLMPCQRNEIWQ
jgi:hypothetical protein